MSFATIACVISSVVISIYSFAYVRHSLLDLTVISPCATFVFGIKMIFHKFMHFLGVQLNSARANSCAITLIGSVASGTSKFWPASWRPFFLKHDESWSSVVVQSPCLFSRALWAYADFPLLCLHSYATFPFLCTFLRACGTPSHVIFLFQPFSTVYRINIVNMWHLRHDYSL